NGVRHDLVTLSAIAGTKPVATFGPDRGVSTQAFYPATLRPFCTRERSGGPEEACDEQDQGHTPPAPAGWRDELPADRPGGGLRQDGGGRVPATSRGGRTDELGHLGRPRRGRARGAAVSGVVVDEGRQDAGATSAFAGLGAGPRGADRKSVVE